MGASPIPTGDQLPKRNLREERRQDNQQRQNSFSQLVCRTEPGMPRLSMNSISEYEAQISSPSMISSPRIGVLVIAKWLPTLRRAFHPLSGSSAINWSRGIIA